MYNLLPLVLACSSLLESAIAKPIADVAAYQAVAERDVELLAPRYGPHTQGMIIRRDANKTFDLGFEATDVTLFSGSWPALGSTFSLDIACVECRTYGELNAFMEFPDNLEELLKDLKDFNVFNDASLTIGFQGVGASVDLSVTTQGTGHFTIPLFKTETPLGISGPGFQAGISFGVDLIIGITAEIEAEGGFEVSIPDGSSFTIEFDPKVGNSAKFNGASAALLPLSVNAPASITVALRLEVQGGIELPSIPLLEAKALAGAYINIPEVILGEQFSLPPANGSDCILPVSAEININAGASVDIGASIADITLGDFDPSVSTTFFDAKTSTCFVTVGQETATPAITGTGTGTGTGAAAAATTIDCPSALVTSTATTTSTYTITSCAAAVVNCPNSLAQVIVVTEPITMTTSSCPVSVASTPAAIANGPFVNATTSAGIALSSLSAPVTSTVSIDSSVVTPEATLITGSAKATVTESASGYATVSEVPATNGTVTVKPRKCSMVTPSSSLLSSTA
ncbi:hypothetical protein F4781DRAFT_122302 [Annulohypoxylon bovei var. microspora]|nr:hypothetical protein F4781DRAFT_122302 [Annulohypoxylon bovei var. microspora]